MKSSEAHKKMKFQIMSILLVSAFSVMACSLWMINTQALDTKQVNTQVASILEPTKQLAKKMDKELASKIEQIKQKAAQEAEQAAAAQAAAEAEAAAQQAAAQQAAEQQQAAFQWNESAYSATMYLTENCNQRVEPRVSSASNGILKKGTAVQVVAKTDLNFMKLDNGSFISADYLTTEAPIVNAPSGGGSSVGISGSTGYAQLDSLINGIFAQIFTPGMSDADKIKACYNYLIDHTDYARGTPMPGGFGDTSVEGSNNYIASAAYGCLTTGKGSCNRYSAAFIAMMRCLGYQANYIMGQTHYANGSMDDHVWAEVVIGGTPYIFDPQVEDNMRARGEGDGYSRYWKTYSQLAGKYVK